MNALRAFYMHVTVHIATELRFDSMEFILFSALCLTNLKKKGERKLVRKQKSRTDEAISLKCVCMEITIPTMWAQTDKNNLIHF